MVPSPSPSTSQDSPESQQRQHLDLLVLGSGVAGLSAAMRAAEAHGFRVGLLTKGALHQSTTRWAQGGVAAVLGGDPDSTDLHLADTLAAGAGLCDVDAVRVLVDEGPSRVHELIALGATFDVDDHGQFELAREGGHSLARVIHAGGAATGAEIERALVEAVRRTAASLHEHCLALDLLVAGDRCRGVRALTADGTIAEVWADNVLLATGGAGQLFSVTTNPAEATGDGVAMALRAGVAVADIEFVQFHPTALHHPAMPRPLLSEALRGHGAVLRDAQGQQFVDELAPRDVVSRAMTARMLDQGVDHLWLDARGLDHFDERFPTIAAALREVDLDPATDWLPIAPAAHYLCGGIVTDLDGATSLPGLWAAGETACNGVHGANRLASNSLLDGMVFAPRVIEAIERGKTAAEPTGALRALYDDRERSGGGHANGDADSDTDGAVDSDVIPGRPLPNLGPLLSIEDNKGPRFEGGEGDEGERAEGADGADGAEGADGDLFKARDRLQRAMTSHAGVLRSSGSLDAAEPVVDQTRALVAVLAHAAPTVAACELANLAEVARALIVAARTREESRGAHTRTDHPETSPALRARLVIGGR